MRTQPNLKKESATTIITVNVSPKRNEGRKQTERQELRCPLLEGMPEMAQVAWTTLKGSCIIPQSITMSQYSEYDALMIERTVSVCSKTEVSASAEKVFKYAERINGYMLVLYLKAVIKWWCL